MRSLWIGTNSMLLGSLRPRQIRGVNPPFLQSNPVKSVGPSNPWRQSFLSPYSQRVSLAFESAAKGSNRASAGVYHVIARGLGRDKWVAGADAAVVLFIPSSHFGSMTVSPFTWAKWRLLKVATSLPRSKAVAATMTSWKPILLPDTSSSAPRRACSYAVCSV
jgi:hypothetical protein